LTQKLCRLLLFIGLVLGYLYANVCIPPDSAIETVVITGAICCDDCFYGYKLLLLQCWYFAYIIYCFTVYPQRVVL